MSEQEIIIKIEDILESKATNLLKISHGTVIRIKHTNIALIPSHIQVMVYLCSGFEHAFIAHKYNDVNYIYGKFTVSELHAFILGLTVGKDDKGDSHGQTSNL